MRQIDLFEFAYINYLLNEKKMELEDYRLLDKQKRNEIFMDFVVSSVD